VMEEGEAILVRLADGEGPRGTVEYRFIEAIERIEHFRTLRTWCDERTPLTYVRSNGSGVLLDDEDLFRRAYGEEPAT
jgi:hypothetical protein